jgi:hypothetical protein
VTFSTPSVEKRVVSWRLLVHHALGRYRRGRGSRPATAEAVWLRPADASRRREGRTDGHARDRAAQPPRREPQAGHRRDWLEPFRVACVRPGAHERGMRRRNLSVDDELAIVAVLDARRTERNGEEDAERLDERVALPSPDILPGVVADRPALLRGVDGLAVDDARARSTVRSSERPHEDDRSPDARPLEPAKTATPCRQGPLLLAGLGPGPTPRRAPATEKRQ